MAVELSIITQLLDDQGYRKAAQDLQALAGRLHVDGHMPHTIGEAELARRLLNHRAVVRSDVESGDQFTKVSDSVDKLRAREMRRRLDKHDWPTDPSSADEMAQRFSE